MITLTRKGLTLSISEGMIPARGSQNVPVRYVNDTDEYANYLITPVVGWTERNGLCKSSIAEYSDGIVKLPARAFAQSCMASIAIKMTDPSDPTHVEVTYPQSFFIEKAPDGTLILPPTDEEWKQYIDDFVTQYFNQNIDPEMDEFKAEIIQDQTDFKEQMNEDFNNFIERTDGNPDALYRGYLVSKNNVYSGISSNDGINLGKVVGKSEQFTTNGYQLFNFTDEVSSYKGVTFTSSNGVIHAKGTATGEAGKSLDLTGLSLPAGTYFVSGGSDKVRVRVAYRKNADDNYSYCYSGNSLVLSDDLSTYNSAIVQVIVASGTTVDETVYPMFNQGSTAKPFEPYTGGQASPNPDYPQEIKNVEITKLTSHSRQLFDASKLPTTSQGGATITNNGDGSFTVSGSGSLTTTCYSAYTYPKDIALKLLKAGILRGKIEKLVSPSYVFGIYNKSDGSLVIALYGTLGLEVSANITQDMLDKIQSEEYVLRAIIYAQNGTEIKPGTIKPMLFYDGDGTFEPFHFNEVSTNLKLAQDDVYENSKILRDRRRITFDGSSDENWGMETSPNYRMYINISDTLPGKVRTPAICNRGYYKGTGNNEPGQVFTYKKLLYYYPPSNITTVEAFKTWLQSNPITVEYELETPITEYVYVPTIPSYYPNTVASHNSEVEPTEIEWHVETEKGLENTYMPSLTINSDFQINQRGQTSYSGAVYTVDMWKLHTEVGKLVVNDGYVTLTGSSLIQYIPKNIFETKSYTQVVKLKDENAKVFHYDNFDGTYKELTVDGLKCALEYSTRNKALVFYIWNKDTDINIEYADLYEGNIAYQHQKEDYATALMRCQQYVQKYTYLSIRITLNSTNGNGYFRYPLLSKFKEEPVINVIGTFKVLDALSSETIDIPNNYFTFSVIDKCILRATYTSLANKGKDLMIDSLNVLITCEPLQ